MAGINDWLVADGWQRNDYLRWPISRLVDFLRQWAKSGMPPEPPDVAPPGVPVRRQFGNHEQARQEAADALQSWIRHADRKAAELKQAETSTLPTATPPGQRQDEGTGAGSEGDKPPAPGDALPETVDASGHMTNPKDPSACVAASEARLKHAPAGLAVTHTQLLRIRDKHPEIKRWHPRNNRLCVHLVDWLAYVQHETEQLSPSIPGFSKHLFLVSWMGEHP